jgi:aromatic-L-amino-acid/L-tryptophan decarboxylase
MWGCNVDEHMTPDEFRHWGHATVDWLARYMEEVEGLPVVSTAAPGEIRARLPQQPPLHGEPFSSVLRDLDEVILPGLTQWQSPNFFGYFPSNTSAPAALGELVSGLVNIQGMLWASSPAATELETLVTDWAADMLGLPDRFRSSSAGGGVIQDSASSGALCALLTARERVTGYQANHRGCPGDLTAYASNQVHSSVEKAVRVAGLGSDNLRLIDVDDVYALRPDLLEQAILADEAAGRTPCYAVATVGTTSSTALDPLRPIGEICRRHGVWLHVDAAHAGAAAVCPEFRRIQDGLELADSYCFDPHKWMLTNFDCDCFFVADRASLVRTLSILPEYLRNQATESGAVIDYRDWQLPLGRRFRSLKLWMVIRHYGVEGLRAHIRRHVALAQEFASWVRDDPALELVAPVPLNLVCFSHRAGDAATQCVIDAVNGSGRAFISHTRLRGRLVLRVCVGQAQTEERHVRALWGLIREALESVGV